MELVYKLLLIIKLMLILESRCTLVFYQLPIGIYFYFQKTVPKYMNKHKQKVWNITLYMQRLVHI